MPETTKEAIKAVIQATESSYQDRDRVLRDIWDKYRMKKTRSSESPYERDIITPIVPDAVHDLQATLSGATMRIQATPNQLSGETRGNLMQCSAIERWCMALAHTNGLEQGHDLRALGNHYRTLEGAATFRVVWDEEVRVNPRIDIFRWRDTYIPVPRVGVQTCVFFKTRRAVFDVEQEFMRDENGNIGQISKYKTLSIQDRRKEECNFYDYWELGADGKVYNALLVDNEEFIWEPRVMEGYNEVPIVVCAFSPTGDSDPLMACPPPVYFYKDLIDELEVMLAQEQYYAHKEMAWPAMFTNAEGLPVPEIMLGGTQALFLERGQQPIPAPLTRHVQTDKMMQLVMSMMGSLGVPNVRSPYLSGQSAAIQASMAQKRLETPAAQEEFAWSKVFELAVGLAKAYGSETLPTLVMPQQGSRSVADIAMEFAGGVFGMQKNMLDADVSIRVSIKPELPGEEMRRAQLLGTLRAAGVDWYTSLQAAGFDQPEVIMERYLEEQFIMNPTLLQALAMQYIQDMGLPMPMNVPGRPGTPSPPRMEEQNASTNAAETAGGPWPELGGGEGAGAPEGGGPPPGRIA